MLKSISKAVEELKRDPEHAVTAAINGMVVEMHYKRRQSAADVFRNMGPWEGESAEEMWKLFRESRRLGGSGKPPNF